MTQGATIPLPQIWLASRTSVAQQLSEPGHVVMPCGHAMWSCHVVMSCGHVTNTREGNNKSTDGQTRIDAPERAGASSPSRSPWTRRAYVVFRSHNALMQKMVAKTH